MDGGRLRTGRRLYGGHSGFTPGESPDVAPIQLAGPLPNQAALTRAEALMAGETDERLYGIAQGSEGGTIQPEEYLPIRVLIVDDHPVVRDGVVALLKLENDIEIVGQAENGREAVDLTRELSPDVILMDLLMPVMNGLEAIGVIRAAGWPARVLVLSQYDDEPNVIACTEAGASGFIPKTRAGSFLVDGIRSVGRGAHLAPPNAASAGRPPTGAPSAYQAEPLKSAVRR